MRKIRLLILVLLVAAQFSALPQNKVVNLNSKVGKEGRKPTSVMSTKGLSPQTAMLLLDMKNLEEKEGRSISENDTTIIERYGLIIENGQLYVNAFVIHDDSLDIDLLYDKGVMVGSKVNGIFTALIPIEKIVEISNVKGIKSVRIGEKGELQMDEVRECTWVDWVHQGLDLPQSFKGDGVVVGIIDNGFDYTHPNFYDSDGEHTRIKRVWEQNATSGSHPSGFSYGRELKTENEILNAHYDRNDMSHGSHVTGIAAGCGGTVIETYMGVAPNSDIVLVSTILNTTYYIDAINYIFNYANSVNKPCVINLSIGEWTGPKDGSSAFDQYCDEIVGEGNLLVGAAGNEGNADFHLGYDFYGQDTVLTFLKLYDGGCEELGYYGAGHGLIDIWGEAGKNLKFAINLYDVFGNTFVDWTDYYNANVNNTYEVTLIDDNSFTWNLETYLTIYTEIDAANNKPHVAIVIDNSDALCSNHILLELIGTNSDVNAWGYTSETSLTTFSDLGYSNVWCGDPLSTIGEIGGTGNSIISVGAYTSKNQWTDLNGNSWQMQGCAVGDLAPFSSLGPTADGRVKPDITAPGNVVVSSVNSYDQTYTSNNTDVVYGVTDGNRNWWYAIDSGTSMASPAVTGIVALLLEKYPELTVNQAKQLLKNNAWKDNYTGNIPSTGLNTWGWGKVDAHESMKDLVELIPNKPTITPAGTVSICEGESVTLSAPSGYAYYEWNTGATTRTITVSNSGDFRVRVKNSAGYVSQWSADKHVNLVEHPETPVITLNGNVLTSNALNGNQWYRNGNKISGATGRTYTATQLGNYYTIVTNAYGCDSEKSNIIEVTYDDIEEYESQGLKIYPNPAKDKLYVDCMESATLPLMLSLSDVTGKIIYTKNIENQTNTHVIPLDNIPSGCYIIKVVLQDAVVTKRIVIEK